MTDPADLLQIADLAHLYAVGTDAIGYGDPAAGRAAYSSCFTDDARICAYFPGADPLGPPDLLATGPQAWADAVAEAFETKGYRATQHLIGTVRVEQGTEPGTATMSCCLQATHVLDSTRCVDVANGSYFDRVVRTPSGWRIAARSLTMISYLRLEAPRP